MTKKKKFPNKICVKWEPEDALLIIGDPSDLSRLDADDGDRIAIYTLNEPPKIYRVHPTLWFEK